MAAAAHRYVYKCAFSCELSHRLNPLLCNAEQVLLADFRLPAGGNALTDDPGISAAALLSNKGVDL